MIPRLSSPPPAAPEFRAQAEARVVRDYPHLSRDDHRFRRLVENEAYIAQAFAVIDQAEREARIKALMAAHPDCRRAA